MASELFGTLFEPKPGLLRTDRAAWACVEQCRQALRLDEAPSPIPVDQWIEHPLGIRFGIADLSHLGDGVLGAAYVKEREILISDSITHEGRFRFTCAHELAHVLLHRRHANMFQDSEDLPHLESDRLERQADRFAAAFLMPIPLLERELHALCRDEQLDADYCLTELILPTARSEWLWRALFLPRIKRRFGVSRLAAISRCRDLRLIGHATREFMPIRFENLLREPAQTPELARMRIQAGRPVVARDAPKSR